MKMMEEKQSYNIFIKMSICAPMPLFKKMKAMADKVGLKLDGIIMSLDSIYNSKSNRKAIFNRNMIPNSKLRQCDLNREGRKQLYNPDIFQERFRTIERLFAWEDKFKRLLLRFEHKSKNFYGFKILAYTMINLRHFIFPV